MPKITQYDAPELGLRPTETGITATAAAARRVGAEYNEAAAAQRETGRNVAETIGSILGVAQRAIDHQQISTGMVEGEKLIHNLNMSKEARLKSLDPNDPAYGQKAEAVMLQWHEDVATPALENFGKGFITTHGQQWATQFVRSTQRSMFHQTTADISNAAGISISNNIKNVASVASNNVFQNPTEENVNETMGRMRDAVTGMVATSPIRGVKGAEFQTKLLDDINRKIVQAGATGAIEKAVDPEAAAAEWATKYPQYIDGAQAKSLARAAVAQVRARDLDERRAKREELEARKEASTEATSKYVVETRMRKPGLASDPLAQTIMQDRTLLERDRERLLNYLEHQLKPETAAVISAQTKNSLMAELRPGVRDVNDQTWAADFEQRMWDARLKGPGKPGGMTEADFQSVERQFADLKTPLGREIAAAKGDLIRAVKPSIDKSNPLMNRLDRTGALQLYRFENDLDAKIKEYRAPNSGKDWRDLFNPQKPDFMGGRETIKGYQKSMEESAKEVRDRLIPNRRTVPVSDASAAEGAPAAPPLTPPPPAPLRKPGESYEAYRRRIRGE